MKKAFALARTAVLSAAIAAASLPLQPPAFAAAIPKMDTIRVALYIESPKYKLTVPALTLATTGGMTIGSRTEAGTTVWLDLPGARTIRASLDQFKVRAAETDDLAKAKTIAKAITDAKFTPFIWKVSRSGKTLYQVTAGPFPTKEAAAAAQAALNTNPALAAYAATMTLGGPLYLSAGVYPTEAEALLQQTALNQAGLAAELVYTTDPAGKPVYAVWVGGEADAAALAAVQQQAALVPGLALQPVDAKLPYLVKRADAGADIAGTSLVSHFAFNAADQKVWIAPQTAKITLKEKNNDYRGGFELSQFGGKLAVINELTMEQYLYSVVTSEMGTGWPAEALKAQAVTARTYAVYGGVKYQIANVTDTTLDQAYSGDEAPDVIAAVDATKGEMLADKNGLISPVFSSNSGGITSDSAEIWGGAASYLKSVPSPDEGAAKNKPVWRRVVKADGTVGYVHPAYLKETGIKNPAGLPIVSATEAVKIREIPSAVSSISPILGELAAGERAVAVGQAVESNSYNWIRGPYTAAELTDKINAVVSNPLTAQLRTLQVAANGPSGRVVSMKGNGTELKVSYPDRFRTMLNGLPSTLFEIEETGRYTVLGANGISRNSQDSPAVPYVLGGASASAQAVVQPNMAVMDGSGTVRMATKDAQFIFSGKGYGHGAGMSQWGARGMAEQGKTYPDILAAYYAGAAIVKE